MGYLYQADEDRILVGTDVSVYLLCHYLVLHTEKACAARAFLYVSLYLTVCHASVWREHTDKLVL